jgi:hypothetical protein
LVLSAERGAASGTKQKGGHTEKGGEKADVAREEERKGPLGIAQTWQQLGLPQ